MAEQNAKRVAYTTEMDMALLDEVALMNPFQGGVTWEDVSNKLKKTSPTLFAGVKSGKSIRDRTLLKLGERKKQLNLEAKGSGIEVPELTDEERLLDEILLLKEEAEKMRSQKTQRKKPDPAIAIRDAAMKRISTSPINTEAATGATSAADFEAQGGRGPTEEEVGMSDDSSRSSTPELRRRRRSAADLTVLWKERDEREEKNRKEDNEERRRLQEASIKLREEEMKRRKQAEDEERDIKRQRLEFEMKEKEEEKKEREREIGGRGQKIGSCGAWNLRTSAACLKA